MELMVGFFVVQICLYVLYRLDAGNSQSRHREHMARMVQQNTQILEATKKEKNDTLLLLKKIEEHEEQREEEE